MRIPTRFVAVILIGFTVAATAACGAARSGAGQAASPSPSRSGPPTTGTGACGPGPGSSGGPVSGGDDGASSEPNCAPRSPAQGFLSRVPAFGPPPTAVPIAMPADGSSPFLFRIPTGQPVAFLTIDDGWTKSPDALALLRQAHIPVTLFLEINAIKNDPNYFKPLEGAGAVIEAHTITHPDLRGRSYTSQHHEICDGAEQLHTLYGRRPVLFRPPFGDKDATTLKVAHSCGLHAVFYWRETVDKGIVRYQAGHSIQRGDIILMHFRPAFIDDFIAALTAIKNAGLTPALLENYIPGCAVPGSPGAPTPPTTPAVLDPQSSDSWVV